MHYSSRKWKAFLKFGLGAGQLYLLPWTGSHPDLLIKSKRHTNQGKHVYMREATQMKCQTLLVWTQARRTSSSLSLKRLFQGTNHCLSSLRSQSWKFPNNSTWKLLFLLVSIFWGFTFLVKPNIKATAPKRNPKREFPLHFSSPQLSHLPISLEFLWKEQNFNVNARTQH